jgi:hypothetical protein
MAKLKKYKEFKNLSKLKTDDIKPIKSETKPAEIFDVDSMVDLTSVGIPKDYTWEKPEKSKK